MRLGHIELFVSNPMQSLEFYRDVLGFEVVAIQGEQFVWMKSGDTEVLLRPGSGTGDVPHYNQTSAGFVLYTTDLSSTATALQERGLEFRGTDGSEQCLTFTDPDGHWFQLVNPEDH